MSTLTTITVSSAAGLMDALRNSQGGETILLTPGDYGVLTLNGAQQPFAKFAQEVTIKSANAADPAVFDRLILNGVNNLTFDSVKVELTPFAGMAKWFSAVDIDNSNGLKFVDSIFTGGLALDDSYGNKIGYPAGRGFDIFQSQNIVLEGNDISLFADGINVYYVNGLTLTDNEIHHLRTTPIHGSGIDNLLMDSNHLHSSTPWGWGLPEGDHGDYVHFWLKQGESGDNLVFVNNVMEQGEGTALLGIFLEGEHGPGYTNVVMKGNVIINDHHLGLYLENVDGALVQNNTLVSYSDAQANGPTIYLSMGSNNVIISDNVISTAMSHSLSPEYAATITQTNNLLVQRSNPDAPNYVGDIFVNALAVKPTLADVQIVPGSLGDQLNVGSSLTRFDTTPDKLNGFIVTDPGNGLDLLTHKFDASAIFGPSGALNLTGATVAWNFGDGSSATGLTGSHTWQHAGRYDVTALITLADGTTVNLHKTVEVQSPLAVHANFDANAADLSDITNAMIAGSAVTFEGQGEDLALRLNQGTVAYKRGAELINNSEYTVQVDFKKDVGSENAGGTLVYFSSSFVINVGADSLNVLVTTNKGSSWLKPVKIGISDADWHRLALTFSSKDGAAILYLDGVEVARLSGLQGAIQTGSTSHDLFLGNPFTGSSSFGGLIDNFQFWKGAMSAQEIQALAVQAPDGKFAPLADPAPVLPEPPIMADPVPTPQEPDVAPVPTPQEPNVDPVPAPVSPTEPAPEVPQIVPPVEKDEFDFSDTVFDQKMTGTAAGDKLTGGGGSDYLVGLAGNDLLRGQNGNDVLIGGDGDDQLIGGGGHDVLIGGLGADILTGGQGKDIFAFIDIAHSPANAGRDRITDFAQGQDKIHLSSIDAILGPGEDAFTFIGTAAFSAAGQIRQFDLGKGGIIVEGDVDGDGKADFQISIQVPGLVLTADDFIA